MKKALFVCALFTVFIYALAHEYILLAYKYRLQKGDTLEMQLFVADGFNIQMERPLQKTITKSFELISKDGITFQFLFAFAFSAVAIDFTFRRYCHRQFFQCLHITF